MAKAKTEKRPTRTAQQSGAEAGNRVVLDFEEARSQFLQAIRVPYRDYEVAAQAAYRQYVEDLRVAWSALDAQQEKGIEAYGRYASAIADVWEKVRVQSRCDDAYRTYLKQIKAAFGGIDVDVLEPDHLARVGQSILSAMWYGHATLPFPIRPEPSGGK